MKKLFIILIVASITLVSCKKDVVPPPDPSPTTNLKP